jgi:hypothetical protein
VAARQLFAKTFFLHGKTRAKKSFLPRSYSVWRVVARNRELTKFDAPEQIQIFLHFSAYFLLFFGDFVKMHFFYEVKSVSVFPARSVSLSEVGFRLST